MSVDVPLPCAMPLTATHLQMLTQALAGANYGGYGARPWAGDAPVVPVQRYEPPQDCRDDGDKYFLSAKVQSVKGAMPVSADACAVPTNPGEQLGQ